MLDWVRRRKKPDGFFVTGAPVRGGSAVDIMAESLLRALFDLESLPLKLLLREGIRVAAGAPASPTSTSSHSASSLERRSCVRSDSRVSSPSKSLVGAGTLLRLNADGGLRGDDGWCALCACAAAIRKGLLGEDGPD